MQEPERTTDGYITEEWHSEWQEVTRPRRLCGSSRVSFAIECLAQILQSKQLKELRKQRLRTLRAAIQTIVPGAPSARGQRVPLTTVMV